MYFGGGNHDFGPESRHMGESSPLDGIGTVSFIPCGNSHLWANGVGLGEQGWGSFQDLGGLSLYFPSQIETSHADFCIRYEIWEHTESGILGGKIYRIKKLPFLHGQVNLNSLLFKNPTEVFDAVDPLKRKVEGQEERLKVLLN